jgi:hypothetical protein
VYLGFDEALRLSEIKATVVETSINISLFESVNENLETKLKEGAEIPLVTNNPFRESAAKKLEESASKPENAPTP